MTALTFKIIRAVLIILFAGAILFVMYGTGKASTWYVAASGNNTGTSWANAFTHPESLNTYMAGGDTAWFGTGTWRTGAILAPVNNTSEFTTYACSVFTEGIAELWGSNSVTGWDVYSGSVYRAAYSYAGATLALFQSDSNLYAASSVANVNGAGQWYFDDANNYLYAWCWGGGDPDTYGMEISDNYIFTFDGRARKTQIWGFTLRYAWRHAVNLTTYASALPDSIYIEHITAFHTGDYENNQNTSPIFSAVAGSAADAYFSYGSIVRACSVDWVSNTEDNVIHQYGFGIYGFLHSVIESSWTGPHTPTGILLKSQSSVDYTNQYVTVRYNRISNPTNSGIEVYLLCRHDSIYGNIIVGSSSTGAGLRMWEWTEPDFDDGYHYIFNNTIYNNATPVFISEDNYGSVYEITNRHFRYNIIYDGLAGTNTIVNITAGDSAHWTIENNMYYLSNYNFRQGSSTGDTTFWKGKGWDNASSFATDPGFNDADNWDFSRPSAGVEMDSLEYGGQTWVKYGALQDTGIVPPPTPVRDLFMILK